MRVMRGSCCLRADWQGCRISKQLRRKTRRTLRSLSRLRLERKYDEVRDRVMLSGVVKEAQQIRRRFG
jgi:hypothetical protein